MTYSAATLYKKSYQLMLKEKENRINEAIDGDSDDSYIEGLAHGMSACISILKVTHMIFDMEDDAE